MLEVQRDFGVVARCGDGASCVDAISNFLPDIAVLGVSMPDISGLEILAIARSENLAARLVFFSAPVEEHELQMLAGGAHAVISDEVDTEMLVQTLRQVADGHSLVPSPSTDQVVWREQSPRREIRHHADRPRASDHALGIRRAIEQGNWAPIEFYRRHH